MGDREDQGGRVETELGANCKRLSAVFDGNSLYARCWYASRNGELSTEHSSSVAVTTAALHSLFHILSTHGPLVGRVERILFCWDGKPKTEKPRKPKPPEFKEDREFFEKVLVALFGGAHAHPDTESDDAVATAAYRLADRGEDAVVVSGDKDLHQIVGRNVAYYCLNKKSIFSEQHILDRWQVKRPVQVGVVLAIIGDADDGISGVQNWGVKKAAKAFEAVTEDMGLEEVVDTIAAQLPREQLSNFYESLAVTLLRSDVEGVPDPGPLTFADPEILDDLGLGHLRAAYSRLKASYEFEDSDPRSAVDEEEI
jgi:DNA polymerase I